MLLLVLDTCFGPAAHHLLYPRARRCSSWSSACSDVLRRTDAGVVLVAPRPNKIVVSGGQHGHIARPRAWQELHLLSWDAVGADIRRQLVGAIDGILQNAGSLERFLHLGLFIVIVLPPHPLKLSIKNVALRRPQVREKGLDGIQADLAIHHTHQLDDGLTNLCCVGDRDRIDAKNDLRIMSGFGRIISRNNDVAMSSGYVFKKI